MTMKDSLIFFWRRHRNARSLADKYAQARDELATVRTTLATVARERDHAHSLLRQVRASGVLPFGGLLREINGAVDLGSEGANEDAERRARDDLAGRQNAEPAAGTYWERAVLERFAAGGSVDLATVRWQVAALLGERPPSEALDGSEEATSDQPTVGERIREEREWLGFTQAQLGQAAGLASYEVADFEDGLRTPTDDQLTRLAKVLRAGINPTRKDPP